MRKQDIELQSNQYVASVIVDTFPEIIAASATTEENYKIDDIWFTANTLFDEYRAYQMENKTLKGGFRFKEDGEFRDYFTRDIYQKLRFYTDTTSGTPVYFINAEDKYGNMDNGKWQKLLNAHACLSFLAPDGIIIYGPGTLQQAFVGYADYLVSHTSEFGKKGERHWELKAVIDLSKGEYIPCTPPEEFFRK